MERLPKPLKLTSGKKTIAHVKRHLSQALGDPIENIEILCKNMEVADSHTLEYVRKTRWIREGAKTEKLFCLQYRRKIRLVLT